MPSNTETPNGTGT